MLTTIQAALVRYLLVAMTAWSPLSDHRPEPPDVVLERYTSIASDIAEVALDPEEAPLFRSDDARVQTAVLLASIGFHESRWFSFVLDGSCNRKNFKADKRGSCDHSRAWSGYQIQAGQGLVLLGDTWSWWNARSPEPRITGEDLIRNRQLATRVALHMARQSLKSGSLAVYTGESRKGPHPHADVRLDTAMKWYRSHPFSEDYGIPEGLVSVMSGEAP